MYVTKNIYINIKIDLILKINLTKERLLTTKPYDMKECFISDGPFFSSLKHKQNVKGTWVTHSFHS